MRHIVHLFEATPYDPVAAAEVTVLLSDHPHETLFNGAVYEPYLVGAPTQDVRIFNGDIAINATPTFGELGILIGDGRWSRLSSYYWAGRVVTVKRGFAGAAYGSFTTIFKGLVEDHEADRSMIRLHLRDLAARLDAPLQSVLYDGTGGAEGGVDLSGKPKPKCYGHVLNITPILLDGTKQTYQISDSLIHSITAVRDRGVGLDYDTSYPTYTALAAASIDAGSYAVSYSAGGSYIRLGIRPDGQLTTDVKGDATGGYVETAADLIKRIVIDQTTFGAGDMDDPSFTALNAAAGYACGYYATDTVSVAEVVDGLLRSVSAFRTITAEGKFKVKRFALGTPAATITPQLYGWGLKRVRSPRPSWKRVIGYAKSWTVQNLSDLALNDLEVTYENITNKPTDPNNLIPNAELSGGFRGWGGIAAGVTAVDDPSGVYDQVLQFTGAGTNYDAYAVTDLPVTAGDVLYAEMAVRRGTGANGRVAIRIALKNRNKTHISTQIVVVANTSNVVTVNSWAKRTGNYTIPASAAYVDIAVSALSDFTAGLWHVALPKMSRFEQGATAGATIGIDLAGDFGGANVLPDSSFESGTVPARISESDGGAVALTAVTSAPYHGDYALRVGQTGGHNWRIMPFVAQGTKGVMSVSARNSGAVNSSHPSADNHTSRLVIGLYNETDGVVVAGVIDVPAGEIGTGSSLGPWWRFSAAVSGLIVGKTYSLRLNLDGRTGRRMVDLDGFQFEFGDAPTAYAPRNEEALWSGTFGPGRPEDYSTRNDTYRQSTDPGAVPNGSRWINTSTGVEYVRIAGAWQLAADSTADQAGVWTSVYRVNTSTPLPLLAADGGALPTAVGGSPARILVTGVTTGTGVSTETRAMFVWTGSAWSVAQISNKGAFSNNPEFFLDGGVPSVRLYNHTSLYNVQVQHGLLHTSVVAPWGELGGDGKPSDYATQNTIYRQTSDPGAVANGSIWINTNNGREYWRVGGSWVLAATLNLGALADKDQVTWAGEVIGAGKPSDYATQNTVYRQSTDPGAVANGSIWINTSTGVAFVRVGSSWQYHATYNTGALANKDQAATADIVNNAVNKISVQETSATLTIPASTVSDILSFNFVKDDAASTTKILGYASCYTSDDMNAYAEIWVDGVMTKISYFRILGDGNPSHTNMTIVVHDLISGLAAGTHSVLLRFRNFEAVTMYVYEGAMLEVTEVKR